MINNKGYLSAYIYIYIGKRKMGLVKLCQSRVKHSD